MSKNQKKWLSIVAMAVVFGLVGSLVFQTSNYMIEKYTAPAEKTETMQQDEKTVEEIPENTADDSVQSDNVETTPDEAQNAAEQINSVASVAADAMPSVVAITSVSVQEIWNVFGYGTTGYPTTGSGSGIIVGENEEELLIATNNHVVEGAQSLSVFFVGSDVESAKEEALRQLNGETSIDTDQAIAGQIKGTDETNDLAVVAVKKADVPEETLKAIKFAKIGNSDDLVVGEQVVAIGNALGYGQSVTSGWVSALNRTIYMDNGEASQVIQTDAAINPGNSGGALLNMQGELIGINSAKYASSGVEGMGYAIPISKAEPILEELMNRKTRTIVDSDKAGYLGITTADVSMAARQMYNIPQGVYIYGVLEGGPAEQAGLKKGDVLVSIDGIQVSGTNDLSEKMRYFEAGENVDVIVERMDDGEYQEKTIAVEIGARNN
ncbi:MAG: trypsin-like peptidase domain-containing protein [Eubacteriales bacterium]|nr:trypsin-like peptidase domain-containing protein [Eubacteriales bacterium]